MKRYVLLDTAPIPNNGGALCLYEYGEDFVIKLESGKRVGWAEERSPTNPPDHPHAPAHTNAPRTP